MTRLDIFGSRVIQSYVRVAKAIQATLKNMELALPKHLLSSLRPVGLTVLQPFKLDWYVIEHRVLLCTLLEWPADPLTCPVLPGTTVMPR